MREMVSPERCMLNSGGDIPRKKRKASSLLYWEWRILEVEKMEWRILEVENTRLKSVCHNHRTKI